MEKNNTTMPGQDDNVIINLEMQVINEYNWPERSLTHLCRALDSLNPGEDYQK